MIVVKPYLDCVALGRLCLKDVLLVGDVVVALVLAGEGVGLAVAEVGIFRLGDTGPLAPCSGLMFGAAASKMAADQQTLAAGSLFILSRSVHWLAHQFPGMESVTGP